MQNSGVTQLLLSKEKEKISVQINTIHQVAKHCVKSKYIWDLLSKNPSDLMDLMFLSCEKGT